MARPKTLRALKAAIDRRVRDGVLGRRVARYASFLRSTQLLLDPPAAGLRALVLAPHPDDESIGCGGTIRRITRSGGTVDVVYLTDGAGGFREGDGASPRDVIELRATRRREGEVACQRLGVRKIEFFDAQDGELNRRLDLAPRLGALLRTGEYEVVFCPWPFDDHDDHRAAFRIWRAALTATPVAVETWLYEVWSPLLANRVVDITAEVEAKREAIRAHESQLACRDYESVGLALARYRSVLFPGPVATHAEAFLTGDRRFILELETP